MKMEDIRVLLEKYQQGICTDEERKAIEAWYDSLHLGGEGLRDQVVEDSLARIGANLRLGEGERMGEDRERRIGGDWRARRIRRWDWRPGVAAAVLLLIAGTLWLLRPFGGGGRGVLADSSITVVTGRGETRQVILPDGSTLLLNAGTVFRYPKQFGRASRTVNLLKGEVFLQVAAQPGAPFVMVTGKWRTTVLGTSFDIRSYAEDGKTRIAVLTGKVEVEAAGKPAVVLNKGMLMRGDEGTDHFENDYEVAAWKEGALFFSDASFSEIAFEIGNKYNVGLINRSKKQLWSYTGLFRRESLEEVIETICQTENLAYTFSNNEILIIDK
jgi:ferric-dicitrate binding protein FerR (iron transport regulator)